MSTRLLALLILSVVAAIAAAAPFAHGNVEAGKESYIHNKCQGCHIAKYGGDGSAIFTRKERRIKTANALSTQIRTCSTNLGLMLFEDEEENLAAYLNNTYYQFK